MTGRRLAQEARAEGADEAAAAVGRFCQPIPLPEAREFGAMFDRFGLARVVLLGEATHGTSEFYRARSAITRRLVEKHGFTIVAVEADWPDAAHVDRHVRHGGPAPFGEEAFTRFPTWMWRNRETEELIRWVRQHNECLQFERRLEFRGLDLYSLKASIRAVLDYLDRIDPQAAKDARERYGCLTPWQAEPARYGRAVLSGRQDPCENEAVEQLRELLERRLSYVARDGEDYFDAAQNARIVRSAEQYYRMMFRGSTESWNLRDRHMFDTLLHLLEARGPEAKAIVWAHNSHIGNAAATAMGWEGEFNIGELCRIRFGDDAVLIGFGTDRGTVAAADDWDGPVRIKTMLPARADSFERIFRQSGMARSLTDFRLPERRELREILSKPRLERAIGVIYRPQSELASHYFEAVLPEQFDAYVWFEETGAVTPIAAARREGVPETFPFGV